MPSPGLRRLDCFGMVKRPCSFQPFGDVKYSESDFESRGKPLLAVAGQFERNDLHGFGVTRPDPTAGQQITINTQVNVPEVRVASLPDQKLATRKLLQSPEPHRQRSSPCRMIRCTEITARRCGGGLYGP